MSTMQLPAIGFGAKPNVRFQGKDTSKEVTIPVLFTPEPPAPLMARIKGQLAKQGVPADQLDEVVQGVLAQMAPPQIAGEIKPPLAFWQAQPKIVAGMETVLKTVKARADQFGDDFKAGAAKMLGAVLDIIEEGKAKAKAGLDTIGKGQIPAAPDQHRVMDWVSTAVARGQGVLGEEMEGWAQRHSKVCGTGDPKDTTDHAFRDSLAVASEPLSKAMAEAHAAVEKSPEAAGLIAKAKAQAALASGPLGQFFDDPDADVVPLSILGGDRTKLN